MIVNTCSIASFGGQEGMGAYTAAKSALAALTLVWARDLSQPRHPRDGHRAGLHGDADGRLPARRRSSPSCSRTPSFPSAPAAPTSSPQLAEFIIRTPLLNGDVIRLDAGTRPPARTAWSQG